MMTILTTNIFDTRLIRFRILNLKFKKRKYTDSSEFKINFLNYLKVIMEK